VASVGRRSDASARAANTYNAHAHTLARREPATRGEQSGKRKEWGCNVRHLGLIEAITLVAAHGIAANVARTVVTRVRV